ncbi:PI-PLC X domain-containing protein 3 [Rhopalosiphum maidis]|uniref:PI-PLC X domain-containing protein 3 n=1 Tax=Rhopalosiphum maidis TaxID=43146 RepID=UPI000EFF0A5F|nr:PI-PLC X domain-containing protein 3 [Rhopalosiphum maidis]XP_026822275.1 PI-PLC X domain-containing protein 3 [Rhopalosiphum maidis]XP_026822276.1 PI-PLC X domain-containing protein 3 [Rhopalosiphum maidis]XP_026822277.1 PI-PLC X domain-containing protein 3 [Rhopalosiphum maidis]XP_026822278.1 PI-PLC X domain-containing protein 3 [Rhopalosiphum maidis]
MKLNQEYWVSELPKPLTRIPITELAIPGSHDSFSYTITPHSKLGPDASRLVKYLNCLLGPAMRRFVYKWSITQTCNIQTQLHLGIRYFDLRMATKPNDSNFYTVHALYGDPVMKELVNIKEFLVTHNKEILVLDFQHFYNFSEADHKRLSSVLKLLFHSMICPYYYPIEKLDLDTMRANNWQVIIIYRHSQNDIFWPSSHWPTPWPQTTSYKKLIGFLECGLKERKQNAGYVTQCLFTPDVKFIMRYFYLNLQSCCRPLNVAIPKWINNQKTGYEHGVNVIIADFINTNGFNFCDIVVHLNYKCLKTLKNTPGFV